MLFYHCILIEIFLCLINLGKSTIWLLDELQHSIYDVKLTYFKVQTYFELRVRPSFGLDKLHQMLTKILKGFLNLIYWLIASLGNGHKIHSDLFEFNVFI